MSTRTIEEIEADIADKEAQWRELQVDDSAPPEPPDVAEALDQIACRVERELVELTRELWRANRECPCCGSPVPPELWDSVEKSLDEIHIQP